MSRDARIEARIAFDVGQGGSGKGERFGRRFDERNRKDRQKGHGEK